MRLAPWKMLLDKYGAESLLSADFERAEREGRVPRKVWYFKCGSWSLSSCVPEGHVSTPSGSRQDPLKNCRHVKRKQDSSLTCQDVGQEAATCLDKESSQDSLDPILLVHLAPWDPPVFLREQKPWDRHPLNAGCAKRAFLINLSLSCTSGLTQERGPFNATSVPEGSCSFQICRFTSGSTLARSPTVVISASRSSLMTSCCALTRGPTPRRSLSAVSTVAELSATEGSSSFIDTPTIGSSPMCAPSATLPSVSWGLSNAPRKSIPNDSPRTPPSGPSAICSQKEILNYLSIMWYNESVTCEEVTIILEPDGIPFTWIRWIFEWGLIFPFRFCSLL